MFRDTDGTVIDVGDPVTVLSCSRQWLAHKSHGTIEKVGIKLAHVRLTHARAEHMDGDIVPCEPGELRRGHHGRPRHPNGYFGEAQERLDEFRKESLDELLAKATEQGVLSDRQSHDLAALAREIWAQTSHR